MALSPSPLPRPLSSFVGRRSEIDELKRILTGARLLTLTGPGGCGKTRLAIEVASHASPDFPGGVAFVDLAPVRDPAAVPDSVAATLGLSGQAWDEAAALIGEARMLLVLDNAEHLVDCVCQLVGELLGHCPNLSIVVTSRELLDVAGEVSRRVPPLELPPADALPEPVKLAGYDAVHLFATRAAEHEASFRLTTTNAALVVAVCRRLDGIPLALELAAARVRSLGLAELAKRLSKSFQLLTGGSRTAVDRHRTLRATVDWSYRLLDESEQCLFRRLTVFGGAFDLNAVEAVCSDSALPVEELAEVLHRLVDKSLVVVHPRSDGSLRYTLMEAIRQYGQERLLEATESGLRAVHARYYGELVDHLEAGDDLRTRVESMTAEYDNVRLALEWAADEDPDLEAVTISRLDWFWRVGGSVHEAQRWLLSALAKKQSSPAMRARLHADASFWFRTAGDFEAAKVQIHEAELLLELTEEPLLRNRVLRRKGILSALTGDLAGALLTFSQSIQMLEGLPPSHDLEIALNDLAMATLIAGHPREALVKVEEALRMLTQLPKRDSGFPQTCHTHGAIFLSLKRVPEARDRFLQGLADATAYGNYQAAVALLQGLACCAAELGQAECCLQLLAAARSFARRTGIKESEAPGTPAMAAERAGRGMLNVDVANRAWERGLVMDLEAALQCARTTAGEGVGSPFTPRKMAIVRLVAGGLANKEIAHRLSISERTVEAHLEQVRNQLGFHNRAQVAAWAVAFGVSPVDPDDDPGPPVRARAS